MALQIRHSVNRDDPTNPHFWTVLTSALFARRWLGRVAPHFPQLSANPGPTLLYFRTRGCTVCDLIDIRVAQASKRAGVKLLTIDRYAKSDDPQDQLIYGEPGNILDKGGIINKAYGIGVYPSLVLINNSGTIVMKDVGVKAPVDTFDHYLKEQFQILLSPA